MEVRITIASIPIHILKSGLHLEHHLYAFLSLSPSTFLCSICDKPVIRHMEVAYWPEILIINVHDPHQKVKFRKASGCVFTCSVFQLDCDRWSIIVCL